MEYIHWVKGQNSSRLLRIVKPKIINHSSFIKARNGDQSSSGPRVFLAVLSAGLRLFTLGTAIRRWPSVRLPGRSHGHRLRQGSEF